MLFNYKIVDILIVVFINILLNYKCSSHRVLELDDRVIEYSKSGKWLLEFYAPWCGHCKKFEPIYEEVAKHYSNLDVNVARIDATRYSKAASNFDVKGYPTLKFVTANVVYNFNGDRKLNDIVKFVEKADGPKIRTISTRTEYLKAKEEQKLFFLLISSPDNDNSGLVKNYEIIANKYFLETYFFVISNKEIISQDIQVLNVPSIVVVKEEDYFYYQSTNSDIHSLEKFIKYEQFLTFTHLSISNFHSLIETRKGLLILLTNEDKNSNLNKKLMQSFKRYSETHRNQYNQQFQFAYTDNHDLLSGIAIWSLQTPLLFILNTTNYEYSLIYFNETNIPQDKNIDLILSDLKESKLKFYGGEGWFRQIRRPLWELYRGLMEMFIEAPFISLFAFGLPFGVISIVCYFLCCFEASEQSDLDEINDSDTENENEEGDAEEAGLENSETAQVTNNDSEETKKNV